jgi:hypothetical protein
LDFDFFAGGGRLDGFCRGLFRLEASDESFLLGFALGARFPAAGVGLFALGLGSIFFAAALFGLGGGLGFTVTLLLETFRFACGFGFGAPVFDRALGGIGTSSHLPLFGSSLNSNDILGVRCGLLRLGRERVG